MHCPLEWANQLLSSYWPCFTTTDTICSSDSEPDQNKDLQKLQMPANYFLAIFSFSMSVVMSMPHRFLHNPNQIQTNTDLTTHQFKQKALQVSQQIKNRNHNEKRFEWSFCKLLRSLSSKCPLRWNSLLLPQWFRLVIY